VAREQLQEFKTQAQQAGAAATRLPTGQNSGLEKRAVALKKEPSGPVRAAERRGRPERLFGDGSAGVFWRPNYVGRSVRELNLTGEDENDT